MDIGKIITYIAIGFVALWLLSFIFGALASIVSFAFPFIVVGVIGYFIAKALGLVKS